MKVMTALSGGVDSSVAAHLLKQAGYEVSGATLYLTGENQPDAQKSAEFLNIPFYEFEEKEAFRDLVIEDFARCYERSETPNPCIVCNLFVKFGILLDKALASGHDFLATGHYAKTQKDGTGRTLLLRGKDRAKDQTYMLYRLSQHQLSHSMFPLGDLTKAEIREIAASIGLFSANKPDSQDICFVPDGDYAGFLEDYRGKIYPRGNFIDEEGKILGKHQGVIRYTVGQRKGLGIALGKPAFVLSKNAAENTVVLGTEEEKLFVKRIEADRVNWIACDALPEGLKVTAKTRYSQREAQATLHLSERGVVAEFKEPQRAATPGQAMVFYDGEVVVGGGTIIGGE